MSADSFSSSGTRKRPMSSFRIMPPHFITTDRPVTPSGSFGNALDSSVKRTVLHVCHHAFSRPFHAQIFVLRCQRRYFSHIFDQSHYRNSMIACGLCSFLQPSIVKNYSACRTTNSVHVFQ